MIFIQKIKKFLRRFWQRHWLVILVFCLAFGVRFAYSLFVQIKFGSQAFSAFSDAEAYILIAKNLLERGVYSVMQVAPWIPDSLRTPLYPFLLAVFFWIKIPVFCFILFQNVLAGFVGILLIKLSQIFFKNNAPGFVAALLYAFEPVSVYWNGLVMPDNGFAFLVVLSLFLFMKKRWIWFALCMGIATLARPIGLYFFFVFLFFYLCVAYNEKIRSLTIRIKNTVVMFAVFSMAISPWIIRNKVVFDTYEFSSAGWYNAQFSISRFARENNIPYSEPQISADFFPDGLDTGTVSRAGYIFAYDFINVPFYKNQFLRIVKEKPIAYSMYHVKSMIRSLIGHDYEYLFEYVVKQKFQSANELIGARFVMAGNALWMLLCAFILFGLFLREQSRDKVFLFVFIVWNAFLVAMAGGSWGGRYNLPIAPIMFLLAGYGMYAWYNMIMKFYVRDKRI